MTTGKTNTKADVVVIGGGPAGMMAARRAAECDRSVLLLEKIKRLAKNFFLPEEDDAILPIIFLTPGRCWTNTKARTSFFSPLFLNSAPKIRSNFLTSGEWRPKKKRKGEFFRFPIKRNLSWTHWFNI